MSKTKKVLFSEIAESWLNHKKLSIEKATYIDYKKQLERILEYFIGKTVDEITLSTLNKYYSDEIDRGLTINSIKHKQALIRPILNYALNIEKIIDSNPALLVRLPKLKKFIPNIIEPEKINFILENEKNTPMELPIFMAAVYGMRRSEIVGMKWSSINFKKKIFIINNTLIRKNINGKIVNLERSYGKTDASSRQFPLLDQFAELLSRIKENQEKYQKLNPKYNREYKDYLCLDKDGVLLNPDYITSKFKKILNKYAIKDVRFHDLRHSCATFLYNLGIPDKDIQYWLGHASISTTMNIYTHLNFYKNKTSTAEKLENSFFKKEEN